MSKKIIREWYDFEDNTPKQTILGNNNICFVKPLTERKQTNNNLLSKQIGCVAYTNQIVEDYQDILTEEMGIADTVTKCVNTLTKTLISDIKNTKSQKVGANIYKKSDQQTITLEFDKTHIWQGTLRWTLDNFVNTQQTEQHTSGQFIWAKQELSINIVAHNGKVPIAEIKEVLQHEVHHIYQHICGSQFLNKPDLLNKKITQRYKNSRIRERNIYSYVKELTLAYPNNVYLKAVANILYVSKDIEIEAFANGTYAWLMSKSNDNEIETNKWQTSMGRAIVGTNNSIACLENPNTDDSDYKTMVEQLQYVNYPIEKVVFIGKNAYQKLLKAFARTVNKAKQDINDKEILDNTIFS